MKKMQAFDTFMLALKQLEQEDSVLYSWKRGRLALTHALAVHLQNLFSAQNAELRADMCPSVSKSSRVINPDIIVHTRGARSVLALVCRNDYLSESEQSALVNLKNSLNCELVMAVSFFPQKNYMLLYRAAEDSVEYFHFDRNTLTSEVVRKKPLEGLKEDKMQLKLNIR